MTRGFWQSAAVMMAGVGLCGTAARAAVVMTIDTTNPSAVVITGTGAASAISESGTGDGIILVGVLTGSNRLGNLTNDGGTFSAAGSGGYTFVFNTAGNDLSMIDQGSTPHVFVAGQAAFSGQSTVDLSFLPFNTQAMTGDVHVRNINGQDTGLVVGQYSLIVPEPTSAAFAGVGLIGLLARKRSRAIV